MEALFKLIENSDKKDYTSLLFNIYEDKDYYTIEETYKRFKSISYGFVDGDLHYIRKPRKKKQEIVHFTSDDFKDFPSHKLTAWLAVYLTEEAKEKYKMNMLGLMFNELSEEQHKYWREHFRLKPSICLIISNSLRVVYMLY